MGKDVIAVKYLGYCLAACNCGKLIPFTLKTAAENNNNKNQNKNTSQPTSQKPRQKDKMPSVTVGYRGDIAAEAS